MIKLISIELNKISKHKSIYIITGIMLLFILLNNYLYKNDYDEEGIYKYEETTSITKEIKKLETELSKYNIDNIEDKNIYITTKSKLDVLNIQKTYNKNTWQYLKCNDYLYEDIYNINYHNYITKDKKLLEVYTNKYLEKLNYFKEDNYKYFLNIEKEELNKTKKTLENNIKSTKDKELLKKLNEDLKNTNDELDIINYRINKDINYSNTYLNIALTEYQKDINNIEKYNKKQQQYKTIISNIEINKYIIEHKQNINKENTINYQLRTILEDYELFVIIVILILGSILIGEELNKGTIKLLLIKPYTRTKILLSKYLSALIVIAILLIILVLGELIIGGLLLDLHDLKIPVLVYNFNLNKLEAYNIFVYMLIKILARIPILIAILSLSFLFNIILNNTIASFSITMLLYTFSEMINSLIIKSKIKALNYFITMNWNFQDYLFGNIGEVADFDLKKIIAIYSIYVIIILILINISFKNKNIKNI